MPKFSVSEILIPLFDYCFFIIFDNFLGDRKERMMDNYEEDGDDKDEGEAPINEGPCSPDREREIPLLISCALLRRHLCVFF